MRIAFEDVAREIGGLGFDAAEHIRDYGDSPHAIEALRPYCLQISQAMLACLQRATHIVNYGSVMQYDDPQDRIDRLMQSRSNHGRRRDDRA